MSEEKKAPKREYSTEAGPVKQRKVKDVPFIILFVLMWVGMFIISGLAISKGNIKRLKYGRDYLGNLCGDKNSFALPDGNKVDFDFTTKKYLYFVDVGFVKNPNSICVDACPSYSNTTTVLIKDIIDAQYKKVPAEFQVNSTIPQPYYDVRSTAYRCVPSSSFKYNFNVTQYGKPLFGGSGSADQNEAQDAVMADQGEKNGLSAIWETLENSVGYIAIALLIGTLLSILWLVVIQIFGKFMIWFTLVFTNFAFFGLGAFFLANYSAASKGKAASYSSKAFSSAAQNENVMLGCGITCLSIGVLLLAVTIFMGRRIHLAVDLMSEASIAMRAMPSLMLMPVIKYVLLLGVFAWSLFIMSLLASSGDMIAASVTNGSEKIASKYEPDQVLNYLQIYYLFGTFWTFNFIVAVAETITAGAVAQWYWTLDRKNLPKKIVWDSVVRTLKYHLGSVAIGSLLIAILQTLRAMLSYAQMHSKKAKSIWVKRALSCLSCCLFCFEKALKFLNTNAYIEIAIYGFGFCEAAKEAFHLLWRNAARALVVNGVGDFIIFLGKAAVTASTVFITFFLLNRSDDVSQDNEESKGLFMMPLLFVALGTYFIASLFTSVFKLSVQTIFLSLLEDGERNDGSAAKPFYAPQDLVEFLNHKPAGGMTEKK